MSTAVHLDVRFETLTCWSCGISFAMPATTSRKRSENGKPFWCPNGCKLSYGESELDKAKKETEKAKKRTEWAEEGRRKAVAREDRALRRVSAMKGVVTKVKKRVGNGVCPCCNRTFQNVARHMKSQHPSYAEGDK